MVPRIRKPILELLQNAQIKSINDKCRQAGPGWVSRVWINTLELLYMRIPEGRYSINETRGLAEFMIFGCFVISEAFSLLYPRMRSRC
jgi:hypothetical protein